MKKKQLEVEEDPTRPALVGEVVLRKADRVRWRKMWQIIIPFFTVSLILDIGLSLFALHAIHQTNHNATIQRQNQLAQCLVLEGQGKALRDQYAYQISKQQRSLKQIAKLAPSLNTAAVRKASIANIKSDVAAYKKVEAAFPVHKPDYCDNLYG